VPEYYVDECSIEIARDAILIDTGVLVALFHVRDDNNSYVEAFFDMYEYQWLIPVVVVVETWGLLGSRTGRSEAGLKFFAWMNTPGKRITVLPQTEKIEKDYQLLRTLYLDCVDAMIATVADEITNQCDLEIPLPIATFDADLYRIQAQTSLRMTPFHVLREQPPYH
jgi:predicted nucleic acid-binding protein